MKIPKSKILLGLPLVLLSLEIYSLLRIIFYVRALIKGKFSHLPAVISEMYFPENFGRTAGGYFEIE